MSCYSGGSCRYLPRHGGIECQSSSRVYRQKRPVRVELATVILAGPLKRVGAWAVSWCSRIAPRCSSAVVVLSSGAAGVPPARAPALTAVFGSPSSRPSFFPGGRPCQTTKLQAELNVNYRFPTPRHFTATPRLAGSEEAYTRGLRRGGAHTSEHVHRGESAVLAHQLGPQAHRPASFESHPRVSLAYYAVDGGISRRNTFHGWLCSPWYPTAPTTPRGVAANPRPSHPRTGGV